MVSGRPTVLLATRNVGKRRELVPLLAAVGLDAETLEDAELAETDDEDAVESGDTFEANALAKARWFHRRSGGRVVVADDSGLEVEALDGAPGVRSKRWAARCDLEGAALDDANNEYLLQMLSAAERAGRPSRRARFVCAAACVWSGGELVVRGSTDGVIARARRGAGGFGYDPYFLSDDLGATFAEATTQAKSAVSHRGRAFALLVQEMQARALRAEFL